MRTRKFQPAWQLLLFLHFISLCCSRQLLVVPSYSFPTLFSAFQAIGSENVHLDYEIQLSERDYVVDSLLKLSRPDVHVVVRPKEKGMSISMTTSSYRSTIFTVAGRDSLLELVRINLNHMSSHKDRLGVSACISAVGKSKVSLVECNLHSSHGTNLWFVQNSQLEAKDCSFRSDEKSGIVLLGSANAVVRNCLITNCGQHGICLRGSTELQLYDTKLENNVVRALYGYASCSVSMMNCEVTRTKSESNAAIEMHLNKKQRLERNTMTKLTMNLCNIVNNEGVGICIRRNDNQGSVEEGEDSVLSMNDCRLENNGKGNIVYLNLLNEVPQYEISSSSDELMDWQFELNDNDEWMSYDAKVSQLLEMKYREFMTSNKSSQEEDNGPGSLGTITLPSPLDHYSINFDVLLQTNLNTFYVRNVRRIPIFPTSIDNANSRNTGSLKSENENEGQDEYLIREFF